MERIHVNFSGSTRLVAAVERVAAALPNEALERLVRLAADELQTRDLDGDGVRSDEDKLEELEWEFAGVRLDYLSFVLDEIIWERKWGYNVEGALRLLDHEITRWELDEDQEVELAAALLDRHGLRIDLSSHAIPDPFGVGGGRRSAWP